MSKERAKGTAWETAIVGYLRACGVTGAERRALAGNSDRGDIAGLPVVIEAKNAAAIRVDWIDEANRERDNAGADLGVAWVKRRGKTSPANGLVLMDGATFIGLLRAAGYIPTQQGASR